ncbi:hypothetical protein FV219_00515 [Methylobacterium sp. WL122]|nr:hypothetical protein FV219_00515 [Methylobacterium sp. WL122]
MTIALSWLRRRKNTVELVLASDSRLRSYGAMDQGQKLFKLVRADCCLAFCGDAQVAYPFFIQVGTALDNFVKTRTRAQDVTSLSGSVGQLLNNLVSAWKIPAPEKREQLATTRIMFGGWSWEMKRFHLGYFIFDNNQFVFRRSKSKSIHPWRERSNSLVFIGDYEEDYMSSLRSVLEARHGLPATQNEKIIFDFDYEPVEALYQMLQKRIPEHTAIGGSPQLMKIYPYSNTLPFVVRTEGGHFLLGRKLFDWEKTEYPVLDLTKTPAQLLYPMQKIPLPADLDYEVENQGKDEDLEAESSP